MLPMSASTSTQHHKSSNASNNSNSTGSSLKRSSSMIFRIEHLLPSTSNSNTATEEQHAITDSSSEVKEQLKISKRNRTMISDTGVFVSQFTPKGTLSECMATVTLMSSSAIALESEHQNQRIYCTTSDGILCMSANILRQIKLSEDIHSYNALLELHKGQVRLRLVHDIQEGEQIVAWFCEEMSILMSIPFLTLHNIQGDKRYTCHVCQQNFETPHPLKLHLALSCDRNSIDILFIRLYYAVTFNQQQQMLSNNMPTMSMSIPMPTTESQTISLNYTTNRSQHRTSPINVERYSAFRPIKSTTASLMVPITTAATPIFTAACSTITTTTSSAGLNTHASNSRLLGNVPMRGMSFLPQLSTSGLDILQAPTTTSLNAAAQIEAIVSNMGASKGGHLCLYCGKCYSRKYGLKIHIRTHTGFKPLKCKFCLRPFGDPSNLNKHVRLHLQANSITLRTDVHKCHLCHKALARRRDLQRHLESRHAAQIKISSPSSS